MICFNCHYVCFLFLLLGTTGLSNGGKIAFAVVFVLLAVAFVGTGVGWYWKKRRAAKAPFDSKPFNNPIHYTPDQESQTSSDSLRLLENP